MDTENEKTPKFTKVGNRAGGSGLADGYGSRKRHKDLHNDLMLINDSLPSTLGVTGGANMSANDGG